MIELGKINTLEVLREVSFGLYLGKDDDEVLLPIKYEKEEFELGDWIDVFVYLDNEGRTISTTLNPKILLDHFAVLKVNQVTQHGAFFEMGIDKDLFVPFKEQREKVQESEYHLVYMYLDEKTERLVGSTKTNKFINFDKVDLEKNQEVSLLIYEKNQFGYAAIVDNQYKGMLFESDIFEPLQIGSIITGFVKNIRDDNKIDLRIQKVGMQGIEDHAQKILDLLKKSNGFLNLNDKSNPEDIKNHLKMSKKAFKKAIGTLYKKRLIKITDQGIELVSET